MMTVIVNGKTYPANWFWPLNTDNTLRMEITDDRALFEIAQEFESAASIEKKSAEEGDLTYINNGRVLSILRPDANAPYIQIIMERGEKIEHNPSPDS